MSEKAKELAGEIVNLLSEFKDCSPDISGYVTVVGNDGSSEGVEWNLFLDSDGIQIVVDTGINAIYLDMESLNSMLDAGKFFAQLDSSQRAILMSILENSEEHEEIEEEGESSEDDLE